MEAQHDSIDPQQGRINAALQRLAELIDEDPLIDLKIQLDAQQEAEREAERLCDQLKEDGMSIIEIAEHIERRKPR